MDRYTPGFVEMEEHRFYVELTRFLNDVDNEGKTEFNYLKEKIEKLQLEKEETDKISEENIIQTSEKESRVSFQKLNMSKTDYDLYMRNIIEREIKNNIEKIKSLNNKINFYQIKFNRFKIQNNITDLDFSDSNAVQKIIYLRELGIIDLLLKEHCFASSTNNLAKVITAITGEKIATIQPYLNVLINGTGNDNNNPYKSKKTVEKVKSQLINLGVKLN